MKSQIHGLLPTASHPKNTATAATRAAVAGLNRKSTECSGSNTLWSAHWMAPRIVARTLFCSRAWLMTTPRPYRSSRLPSEAGRRRMTVKLETFWKGRSIEIGLLAQRVRARRMTASTGGLYQRSSRVRMGTRLFPRRRYSGASAEPACTHHLLRFRPLTSTFCSPAPVASSKMKQPIRTMQIRAPWPSSEHLRLQRPSPPIARKTGSV
mmetsp:Transcript_62802/g.198328  ORF Transcript_62802/g.198328 Transcript_62802/m.198328 type:complete len:209 (+) Transcript_62802:541-1167(+)